MLVVGKPVSVEWTSKDVGAAGLAVVRPDGTELSPAPTPTNGGATHSAKFTPPIAGLYTLQWSTTNDAFVDVASVWPLNPRMLVSVSTVMEDLFTDAQKKSDNADSIALYIAAATPVIESLVGPVLPVAKVFKCAGGVKEILLPNIDVEVQSVTVSGTTLIAETQYVVDEHSGVIESLVGNIGCGVPQSVVVNYTAGRQDVPENLQRAVIELVRHQFRSTRRAGRPGAPEAAADTQNTPYGFAVPKKVIELCAATPSAPGFG